MFMQLNVRQDIGVPLPRRSQSRDVAAKSAEVANGYESLFEPRSRCGIGGKNPRRTIGFSFLSKAWLSFYWGFAIAIPSIANENVTGILGWLFLLSGATGLLTTYWARQAPGFLWSLVSALLAILVGVVLIENMSQDLYGGMLGWPFHNAGPMRLILVLFFLVEVARRSCSRSSTCVSSPGIGR